MINGPLISTRRVEDYPEGMRVNELDFDDAGTWVAPFKASIFTIAANAASPVDQHEVRECWVVIAGCGELTTADDTVQLEPGSVTYFESRRPHQVRNVGNGELKIFSTWWKAHG
jgi:mannose-6-phosphate isomerase-like protein (cupin superfamily)